MATIFTPETVEKHVWMDAALADRTNGSLASWVVAGTDNQFDYYRPSAESFSQGPSMKFTFTMDEPRAYNVWIRIDRTSTPTSTYRILLNGTPIGTSSQSTSTGTISSNVAGLYWHNVNVDPITIFTGTHELVIEGISTNLSFHRVALTVNGNNVVDQNTGFGTSSGFSPPPSNPPPPTVPENEDDPVVIPTNYLDWLAEESRDDKRTLLLELEHSNGVVRYSSRAFLSDQNAAYDDSIIGSPYLEESLNRNIDVGDIEFVVEEFEDDISSLDFAGYPCRWYFGDVDWKFSQFELIATATIENTKNTDINKYQVDLLSTTNQLNTTFFTGADTSYTESFAAAIQRIEGLFGQGINIEFVQLRAGAENTSVTYTLTENTNFLTLLDTLCKSINHSFRVKKTSSIQILFIDTEIQPALTITDDAIIQGSLTEIENIPAYARVTVVYGNDQRVTVETEANTGIFTKELVIETVLTNLADAQALADAKALYHQSKHFRYRLDVVNVADVLSVGDIVQIQSSRLNRVAVVETIKRTPLDSSSTIEVII